MNIAGLVTRSKFLLDQNSTTLLTGIGVVGTVSTAILAGRSSIKAYVLIDQVEDARCSEHADVLPELTFQEKVSLVWPQFIPPVGVGSLTIAAIVMAHKLGAKEAAALATAYGLSERAFQEYKEKVVEKLGDGKEEKIRQEIVQDRITANPVQSREVIIAGTGEVLCYDLLTGRYFQSTIEEIKRAENKINFELVNHMYASLSQFYDEIGLPPTNMSDIMGFNIENRLEIRFDTAMSTDGRPCVAIDFHFPPKADFRELY